MSDARIDIKWARKYIAGFAAMQDTALAVKKSEAEYMKLKQKKGEEKRCLSQ